LSVLTPALSSKERGKRSQRLGETSVVNCPTGPRKNADEQRLFPLLGERVRVRASKN